MLNSEHLLKFTSSNIRRSVSLLLLSLLLCACNGSNGRTNVQVDQPAENASVNAAELAEREAWGSGAGLQVEQVEVLSERLIEIHVTSAALPYFPKIRILFPRDYQSDLSVQYPVLYLFHGGKGSAADWTEFGEAEASTEGLPVIVVMPDVEENLNNGGWCANWFNGGAGGPPKWETFHIEELIPWVEGNFRVISNRSSRAIAGVSEGGFCTMSYAARFPDLFSSATSFSGGMDAWYDPDMRAAFIAVISGSEFDDGAERHAIFGDPVTNGNNWAGHDPTTLAENLQSIDLSLYIGVGIDPIEAITEQMSRKFCERLVSLKLPCRLVDRGPSTHTWEYWVADFKDSMSSIMASFESPPTPPSTVFYSSARSNYRIYDWSVTKESSNQGFSRLEDASEEGFLFVGAGNIEISTPSFYVPHNFYRITVEKVGVSSTVMEVAAEGDGSLRILFNLNDVALPPPTAITPQPLEYENNRVKVTIRPSL